MKTMKRKKRKYKVYVTFTQTLPIIVEAYNAASALRRAREKAKEMSVDGEELDAVQWVYLEKEDPRE